MVLANLIIYTYLSLLINPKILMVLTLKSLKWPIIILIFTSVFISFLITTFQFACLHKRYTHNLIHEATDYV